jgi:ComF family protein
MQKIICRTKELFFPRRCFFCKKYGDLLCGNCQTLLDVTPVHRPDRNHKYLADIYSAGSYENKYIQKLIHALKYKPFHKGLSQPLAKLIANHFALAEINFDFGEYTIIPVPLASKRLRWRGFNQAEIIARELGKIWQISIATNCLARIAQTKNQAELGQVQRRENVKGAFACNDNGFIKNKSILLVDDVVTTGATMNECARILSKNNARKIIGICIARTEN